MPPDCRQESGAGSGVFGLVEEGASGGVGVGVGARVEVGMFASQALSVQLIWPLRQEQVLQLS